MDDRSHRSSNRKREAVNQGMRCPDELDSKRSDLDNLTRLNAMNQYVVEQVVLFEFSFRQPNREVRGVDRHVEFLEDVRKRSQVVLMTVRENDRGEVISVLFEKIKVGDTDVHPVNAFFRKPHSGVNDDHFIVIAHSHTIHPELADSAERDEL